MTKILTSEEPIPTKHNDLVARIGTFENKSNEVLDIT